MNQLFGNHLRRSHEDSEHWISVSDLMAGLMMVFLFISIALMRSALIERDKVKEVAVAYQENQVAIYTALVNEFEGDMKRWDAEIDKDILVFRFKSPDVLFGIESTAITSQFRNILKDFFPRYMGVLHDFRPFIDEVRIEGHTSSAWVGAKSKDHAYFLNMKLSQGRTRSVLEYVYGLNSVKSEKPWIKKHVAAVGFSSSRPIVDTRGDELGGRSRRVSFRVITNADTQIRKILQE
jgi:outer membrane protein OmpA-like peptidoglycan-associated protein